MPSEPNTNVLTNITVPPGFAVGEPPVSRTVAVKVMGTPTFDGAAEDFRATLLVRVPLARTFTVLVPVLVSKSASPW